MAVEYTAVDVRYSPMCLCLYVCLLVMCRNTAWPNLMRWNVWLEIVCFRLMSSDLVLCLAFVYYTLLCYHWAVFVVVVLKIYKCGIKGEKWWQLCIIPFSGTILWNPDKEWLWTAPRDALVSRNLATTNHPIWERLQSANDLEVHTPKVITIAAFR